MPLSYFANVDLDRTRAASWCAAGTSRWATTSTGHRPCAEAVLAARAAGTNLAFLGANTMYWRVRLEARPRTLVGYRDDAYTDPLPTSRPRAGDLPVP